MSTVPFVTTSQAEAAPHVSSARAERSGRRYFVVIILAWLLLYLFPFVWMRSGIKTDWALSYWGRVIETSYHHEGQNADIVIFGDSTAATNFDPERMSRDLGLKVIVLPNVSTSLPVTGYEPLENYLKINKPPRLILFYLSGWDLDFMHNPFTQIVEEGEEMLLLHAPWSELMHYARANPRKVLMFPLHFYDKPNRLGDLLYFRKHEDVEVKNGHITYLAHANAMRKNCTLDIRGANGIADTSAREGISRFTTSATKTMVFVSPLPRCKNLDAVKNVAHADLDMPPIQVLPPSSFRDDGWQAHMLSSKIGPSTDYLEAAIRQKLSQ